MQIFNIKMLPIAREDIADIYCYIAIDNPGAALAVTDNIIDKIDTLTNFPARCPLVPEGALAQQEFRMLIIGSYIAFFKISENDVWVYRVLHGKRDYPHLLAISPL